MLHTKRALSEKQVGINCKRIYKTIYKIRIKAAFHIILSKLAAESPTRGWCKERAYEDVVHGRILASRVCYRLIMLSEM